MSEEMLSNGFRPSNLPAKSEQEKEKHLVHVLGHIRSSSPDWVEKTAVDFLLRSQLFQLHPNQLDRLWGQYGLPSGFVREHLWAHVGEILECEISEISTLISTRLALEISSWSDNSENRFNTCLNTLMAECAAMDKNLLVNNEISGFIFDQIFRVRQHDACQEVLRKAALAVGPDFATFVKAYHAL